MSNSSQITKVGMLSWDPGRPTSINELQERLFVDFIFLCWFYIDDPLMWRHGSNVFFKVFCGFPTSGSLELEVPFDDNPDFPISFYQFPADSTLPRTYIGFMDFLLS